MSEWHGWHEVSCLEAGILDNAKFWEKTGCRVIVSHEDRFNDGKKLWHLSISRSDRYPDWEEIKDARYSLLPLGLTFAQILPPMNQYTNIHPNCFHLWEIREQFT